MPHELEPPTEPTPTPTVRDLMRLRRDLRDMYNRLRDTDGNDPKVVCDAVEIERQICALDLAIEQALQPEEREAWLKVTATWKKLDDTFEDPSSIFYRAVRTDDPSMLPSEFADWLIASPTPERVRELRAYLGDDRMGVIQRAVAEKLLGRTSTGEYDYREFPDRLENLSEDFRNELFGQGHQKLRDIAAAARALNTSHGRPDSG